jgi:hypothetical protein
MPEDYINKPPHYNLGDPLYETINVIEDCGSTYKYGNALKYLCRAYHKGTLLDDLKKSQWYITRLIECPEDGIILPEDRDLEFDDCMTAWGIHGSHPLWPTLRALYYCDYTFALALLIRAINRAGKVK